MGVLGGAALPVAEDREGITPEITPESPTDVALRSQGTPIPKDPLTDEVTMTNR